MLEEMNENEMMKAAMRERGMTQVRLAEKLGTTQNNLSGNMNRRRVSMDVFRAVLDALEYDVIVVDRQDGREMWRLEM